MKPCFIFSIVCGMWLWLGAGIAAAQTAVPTPVIPPNPPLDSVDTQYISVRDDFFGPRFSLNGQGISDEQALEKIIDSVDDDQTSQNLRDSENHNSLGWVFIGGGTGLLVVGGLAQWDNNNSSTLSDILVITGLSLNTLGGLLCRESRMEQMDAVNRYNQIVRQDNGITFLNLPRQQAMGLALVQRF